MGNFEQKNLKHELQSIISGADKDWKGNLIQTAANYLRESKWAGSKTRTPKYSKSEEAQKLGSFIELHNFWFTQEVDEQNYIIEGGEQRAYLDKGHKHVIKVNDSVYYAFWEDYFYSLLIHNHLLTRNKGLPYKNA